MRPFIIYRNTYNWGELLRTQRWRFSLDNRE